jgi:hypothetical protein
MVHVRLALRMLTRKEGEQCDGVTGTCRYVSLPLLTTRFCLILLPLHAGLHSYSLMRRVACLADQYRSTYCYVDAASSSNPSDLYIYSLPFGLPLPNGTTPTCSNCTKSVMTLFGAPANQTDDLKQTFQAALNIISAKCGPNFVHTQPSQQSSSSATLKIGDHATSRWAIGVTLCILLGL